MDPPASLPGFEFSCVIFSVILTPLGLSVLLCEIGNHNGMVLNEEACQVGMRCLAPSKVAVKVKGGNVSLRGAPVCGRDFRWGCSVALNAGEGVATEVSNNE